MKIKSVVLALLLFTAAGSYAQEKKTLDNVGNANPNQASFKFNEEEYNFGTIKQGESVTHEFSFTNTGTNTGTEPLVISKAEGSCGCTVPTYPQQPIMKGQTAAIKVTFNSTGKLGIQDKTVTLTSNAIQNPMIIHIKGTVEKPVEQPATETPKN
jgi:hypothetical protein